ncbi:MAG: ABC transporter permease [Acidobacteria bacterium]|nr:ABC transporter permease [Acidobacteriota bacterium]
MQEVYEDFRIALGAVRVNKLRAFLTILGVVIGVITVMLMVAFIVGIQSQVEQSIEAFGTRTIFIHKFNPGIRLAHASSEERQRPPLTAEDAISMSEYCPSVEVAVPITRLPPLRTGNVVRYRDQELYTAEVQGTLPAYERISSVDIGQGRFFSDSENQHRQQVCVIGYFVADKLFGNQDAPGKELQINNKDFTIIGVLAKQENLFAGEDSSGGMNGTIFIPFGTLEKIYPQQEVNWILAEARPGAVNRAIDEITELLRRRRAVPVDKPDNFAISTPESMQQDVKRITFGIFMLMISIASVALLVGGIGVMNIMLVSVTERTREIGIRKAIGARRSNITWQFLTEAMVLTGLGGVIGIALGWGLSLLLKTILPTYVPLWAPLTGLGVSVGVGLFFGLWPAIKAARLDPVEALRYE